MHLLVSWISGDRVGQRPCACHVGESSHLMGPRQGGRSLTAPRVKAPAARVQMPLPLSGRYIYLRQRRELHHPAPLGRIGRRVPCLKMDINKAPSPSGRGGDERAATFHPCFHCSSMMVGSGMMKWTGQCMVCRKGVQAVQAPAPPLASGVSTRTGRWVASRRAALAEG